MELRLRTVTLRNFMRFGDKPTSVALDETEGLVLVVGANGHGKSTIVDAVCYALTGRAARRSQPGKLVNNINKKNMVVTLDFSLGNVVCRITRGQKPGTLRWWAAAGGPDEGGIEQEKYDQTRDSIATTAAGLERFLKFDNDLCCFMMINSTRRPTFFQSDSATQKAVVESLFGFGELTRRGEAVRSFRESSERAVAIEVAKRAERAAARARIVAQVEAARARLAAWERDRSSRAASLRGVIGALSGTNFELEKEKISVAVTKREAAIAARAFASSAAEAAARAESALKSSLRALELAEAERAAAEGIDVDDESTRHDAVEAADEAARASSANAAEAARAEAEAARAESIAKKALESLGGVNCPTCGQPWPDDRSAAVDAAKEALGKATERRAAAATKAKVAAEESSRDKAAAAAARARLKTKNRSELMSLVAVRETAAAKSAAAEAAVEEARTAAERLKSDVATLENSAVDAESEAAGAASKLKFKSAAELARAEADLDKAASELKSLEASVNPHAETVSALEADVTPEKDSGDVERLESDVKHATFLEKLLTRKDSPVRRAVTSLYLPYMNSKMNGYLGKLGLPYTVEFSDDLSATITDVTEEVDPGAMSGGEEERVSMALNMSFRDAFEEVNGVRLTWSCIDERLDSGLDAAGSEAAVDLLYETAARPGQSVWLVTHKREFDDHASRVIRVVKDGRFSKIE